MRLSQGNWRNSPDRPAGSAVCGWALVLGTRGPPVPRNINKKHATSCLGHANPSSCYWDALAILALRRKCRHNGKSSAARKAYTYKTCAPYAHLRYLTLIHLFHAYRVNCYMAYRVICSGKRMSPRCCCGSVPRLASLAGWCTPRCTVRYSSTSRHVHCCVLAAARRMRRCAASVRRTGAARRGRAFCAIRPAVSPAYILERVGARIQIFYSCLGSASTFCTQEAACLYLSKPLGPYCDFTSEFSYNDGL